MQRYLEVEVHSGGRVTAFFDGQHAASVTEAQRVLTAANEESQRHDYPPSERSLNMLEVA